MSQTWMSIIFLFSLFCSAHPTLQTFAWLINLVLGCNLRQALHSLTLCLAVTFQHQKPSKGNVGSFETRDVNSEFESRVSVRPSNRTLSKLHFFLFPMLRGIGKKRKKSTFGWTGMLEFCVLFLFLERRALPSPVLVFLASVRDRKRKRTTQNVSCPSFS